MLKSFKSASFDLKLFEPWKFAVGCVLSMLVFVHAYAAEKPGGVGAGSGQQITIAEEVGSKEDKAAADRAKASRGKSSTKFGAGSKEAAEQAKEGRMKSSTKFGAGSKGSAEQIKEGRIRPTTKFGAGATESAADKKMQTKGSGMAMNSGKTNMQMKQMQQMQGQKSK
jgi:hypothetical protein